MLIEQINDPDQIKLVITGDIRFQTLIPFREKILSIEQSTPVDMLIDMRDVDNVDSTAIGLLIRLFKHQKSHGKALKIVNSSQRLGELFKFSSLSEALEN
jgi:anti-anti-sigma factor